MCMKMTEKIVTGITPVDEICTELLNPFVHHLELESTSEKIKTALLTILLLPLRVAVILILLVTGWVLACVGLWGVPEEELQARPITGWRSGLRVVASHLVLWIFYVGGFRLKIIGNRAKRSEASVVALAPHSSFVDSIAMVYMTGPTIVAKGETAAIPFFGSGMQIVIKGKQATRQEAPILVIAPHSTFLDGGIVYFTGFPSIIVRRESGANPYIGKLINFTQPVYVWRDDPNSRQNTIKEIIHRAKSDLDWPQILIFPEGTCTNRSCLITFKPGAFYPGVPVQPVCIRYPNKLDTVTWTWEGPSALKLLWLTLSQVYSSCEIEFLPVYNPSEEEKKDPKLFAHNVRAVMAKALGVPVSDYTYDDCKLITRAKEMNLPNANALLEVQKIRHKLKLDDNRTEEHLVNSKLLCQNCSHLTIIEFANYLNVPCNDALLQQLFKLYDKNSTGIIDFREYLLGIFGFPLTRSIIETIKIAFKIYDCTGQDKITAESLAKILSHTLAMPYNEAFDIFRQAVKTESDYITFEQLYAYLERKAEYANLFAISKEEKMKSRNGEICPNDFKKNN